MNSATLNIILLSTEG